jgi:L-methionine (R)-S-oxide reductase
MTVPPRRLTPALLQVDAILARLSGAAALEEVCRFLRSEFEHYGWVGVYRLDGAELELAGWSGDRPTEHTRIPLDRGLCGRAARENRSIVVDDVRNAPEYLACFLETRSEIVVPVRDGAGRVLGEIDIDGYRVGAYDASDERFLSQVAAKIAGAVEGSAPPAPLKLVRAERASGAPPP